MTDMSTSAAHPPAGRTGSSPARRRGRAAVVVALLLATTAVVGSRVEADEVGFTEVQLEHARVVHDVATELGASDRALLAGFEAGLVETRMAPVLDECETDHDSAGLFQQRRAWVPDDQAPASEDGWCTEGEDVRLDPRWSATAFFAGSAGNRGALEYDERGEDRQGRAIGTAGELAQATQVSAFPDEYDEFEADARALLALVTGGEPQAAGSSDPEEVCGAGFGVVDEEPLGDAGTVYLLWDGDSGENCVVTVKTQDVGTPTAAEAFLEPEGEDRTTDAGDFERHAGPVTRAAPGCVSWGGALGGVAYASEQEHCDG